MQRALMDEREATLSSIGRRLKEVEQRARSLERTKERAQQLLREPPTLNNIEWEPVPDLGPYSTTDNITFAVDQTSITNAIYAVERIRTQDDISFSMSLFAALM